MVFIPTYLYIKQHAITGKLYFGKSTRQLSGMLSYTGSGKYWKSHIKHHGKEHVVTLWYQLYDNVFDLVADALSMSYSLDIMHSDSWLNLINETGLSGGMIGYKQTKSHTDKIRVANTGRIVSEKTRLLQSISHKGQVPWNKSINKKEKKARKNISGENNHFYRKKHSIESKKLQSLAKIGKSAPHKIKYYCLVNQYGLVLCDMTLADICMTYNINKSSAYQYVNKNYRLNGYYIISSESLRDIQ